MVKGLGVAHWTGLSTTVIKIPNELLSFGRMMFIPSAEIQRLGESMSRSIKAFLWPSTLLRHFLWIFPARPHQRGGGINFWLLLHTFELKHLYFILLTFKKTKKKKKKNRLVTLVVMHLIIFILHLCTPPFQSVHNSWIWIWNNSFSVVQGLL